jgi:putative NIF3 family GTP cyclohydrolase 1 type 2
MIEQAREVRLETILPREAAQRVVAKMLRAHPYEEVAYDLIPLANRRCDVGLGRIGRLAEAIPLETFAGRVREALGAASLRLVGDAARRVAKVALCGGSGASLLAEAVRQGADVLVTGDVKYHEARNAESQGIAVIDAGHFATEHLMVTGLARTLRHAAGDRGLAIEFAELEGERDPFRVL